MDNTEFLKSLAGVTRSLALSAFVRFYTIGGFAGLGWSGEGVTGLQAAYQSSLCVAVTVDVALRGLD